MKSDFFLPFPYSVALKNMKIKCQKLREHGDYYARLYDYRYAGKYVG